MQAANSVIVFALAVFIGACVANVLNANEPSGMPRGVTPTDLYPLRPVPDPCSPGGLYDPMSGKCRGYDGSECFACHTGSYCNKTIDFNSTECVLVSQGGEPVYYREYWITRPSGSLQEPVVSNYGEFSLAYPFCYSSPRGPLNETLLKLHKKVGNVDVTSAKYRIVYGYGSTQLMEAAMYAVTSEVLKGAPEGQQVEFTSLPPFYPHYMFQANELVSNAKWNTTADVTSDYTVEIVTYPNNPDGTYRTPRVSDKKRVIYDMVYFWPQFTTLPKEPVSEEIMLFSASKHTGHGGSRFGWALVKDDSIADAMEGYILGQTIGVSIDAQLRILSVTQSILYDDVHSFYGFTQALMTTRFMRLQAVFESQSSYELANANEYNTAYAWVKCPAVKHPETGEPIDYSCADLFASVGIECNPGSAYSVSDQYARFTMMAPSAEIDVLIAKVSERLAKGAPSASELEGKQRTLESYGPMDLSRLM